jgi:hypothetical protein
MVLLAQPVPEGLMVAMPIAAGLTTMNQPMAGKAVMAATARLELLGDLEVRAAWSKCM